MRASEIIRTCNQMDEGQRLRIPRHYFDEAFGRLCGFPSIYETPEQAFLSNMVGSAWGTFRVSRDFETGDVIISRHSESDKRYYVDPDREHLFCKNPDGTYEPL